MVHISHSFCQWRKVSLIGIFSAFLLIMSACGAGASSTTTGSNPGSTPSTSPTATVTTNKGNSMRGCPGNAVVSTAPTQANVTIQNKNINSTVTAHVGDIIEIRLPFGQKWSGPSLIPINLQQQQPAGYAFPPANVCVWRFSAQSAGIAHLEFHSQAICSMGQMCPMFIVVEPFTIDVK